LRRRLPNAWIVELPVADGGDGTVDVALRQGADAVVCEVSGPLGAPVSAVSRGTPTPR
jgi:glycerate kinase